MPGFSVRHSRHYATFLLPLAWALVITLWFAPSEIVIRHDAALHGLTERLLSFNSVNQQVAASFSAPVKADPLDAGPGKRLVSGIIETSFAASADEARIPASIVDQFVDLLGERIEFRRDIRRGAAFSILYAQEKLADGKFRQGALLAASLKNRGATFAAIRYEDPRGKIGYYDETGLPLGKQFLRYPLKFSRISSVFSQSRFHPIFKHARPHNGVDFAAPVGTAVRAVADGIVVIAGSRGEAGTMLRLSHGDRYSSAYLHLNSIASGLRVGTRIRRGQVIGTVGMSGAATGPHLHFSLFDHDTYVNPLKAKLNFVTASGDTLPADVLRLALQQLETGLQLAQNLPASKQS